MLISYIGKSWDVTVCVPLLSLSRTPKSLCSSDSPSCRHPPSSSSLEGPSSSCSIARSATVYLVTSASYRHLADQGIPLIWRLEAKVHEVSLVRPPMNPWRCRRRQLAPSPALIFPSFPLCSSAWGCWLCKTREGMATS
jgi:hypothetical protein